MSAPLTDAVSLVARALLRGATIRSRGLVAEPARQGHRLTSRTLGVIVAGYAFDVAHAFVECVRERNAMDAVARAGAAA